MRRACNPHVYAVQVPGQIEAELFDQGLCRLSEERRQKIARFHYQADKNRSLLAELLVRSVLRHVFGIPEQEIRFRAGSRGKPYLDGSGPFFNVSHAGEWVAAVFHTHEAGIDIEQLRPRGKGIAARFFAPEESASLDKMDEHNRLREFYRLWTMKEAYVKASGAGCSIPFASFTFRPEDGVEDRYRVYENGCLTEGRIQPIEWKGPYACAVCATTPFVDGVDIDMVNFNVNKII